MLAAAATAGNTASVLVWMGIGLIAGIAAGTVLARVMVGSWLILVPLFILGGGAYGAWRHENRTLPPSAIPH